LLQDRLLPTPALARLDWILAGLDGAPGWGFDVDRVLSAEFLAAIAPIDYRELILGRSVDYAPVEVVGLELDEHQAKARLRRNDGAIYVLGCTVDPVSPYLLTQSWLQGEVPDGLTPRLPMEFDTWPGSGGRLIVFAGVPGSGKSTVADAVGARLGMPVFSMDWLLGALTPFGGRNLDRLLDIGYEQLTTLAARQLQLGQSAILDSPCEDGLIRNRWQSLAAACTARFDPIVVACGDLEVHRARLASRDRGIPGWHQGGDWADVQRRLNVFEPWPEALTIDSTQPLAETVATVLSHLS
jgi:predicted kinase